MKIVVFGASGKVGQKVVARLLSNGHDVVAFVYGASPFNDDERIKVVQGDIKDAEVVQRALVDCDAVISALGSWGTKSKDILSSGMTNIIPAMQACNVRRIVSLTGADARAPDDEFTVVRLFLHGFFGLVAGKILRDGEKHIELLAASNLEWTVVRSPVMNEAGVSKYVLSDRYPLPWQTIHRNSVADSLVYLCENNEFVHQAPYVVRN